MQGTATGRAARQPGLRPRFVGVTSDSSVSEVGRGEVLLEGIEDDSPREASDEAADSPRRQAKAAKLKAPRGERGKKRGKGKKEEEGGEVRLTSQMSLLHQLVRTDMKELEDAIKKQMDAIASRMEERAEGPPRFVQARHAVSVKHPLKHSVRHTRHTKRYTGSFSDELASWTGSEDHLWDHRPLLGYVEGKEVIQRRHHSHLDGQHRGAVSAHLDSRKSSSPLQLTDGDDSEQSHAEAAGKRGNRCVAMCRHLVSSCYFDYFFGLLVLLNALVVGIQTEWQSRNITESTPIAFLVMDIVFVTFFATELLLRIIVAGRDFFRVDWHWNLFDAVSVVFQLVDICVTLLEVHSELKTNFSFFRVLRSLRLVRVLRLARVIRLIGELRTFVTSIFASVRSLVWACLLLGVMMFVFGVFLTQVVTTYRIDMLRKERETGEPQTVPPVIVRSWGTLTDSVYTLFKAVTGGMSWQEVVDPLKEEVHFLFAPFFAFYILFALLCMFNVITGVFVESALLSAKEDKNVYMVNHLRSLFEKADQDGNGTISWDEFERLLDSNDMKEVFQQVDIDITEAPSLFRLIDYDQDGFVDVGEFIGGCNRLRGAARALELSVLMRDMQTQEEKIDKTFKRIDGDLIAIHKALGLTTRFEGSISTLGANAV